ncbi:U-box domain-containing protein 26 [Rhynchospora pubera]|uniref:U-box domain-containing protein 26 n=1 Tax=Rhynchospora pubera TaxID=906938 RepID=A0AAV8G0X7_9POAL|nr:U-box domain-containing protein 26 [Rhynchospora pubera]
MSRSQHAQPQPKLKPPQRSATLFSCGIFRNCTQSALSPTATPPATSSAPSPPPPPLNAASPSPSPSPPPLGIGAPASTSSLHHHAPTGPSSSSSSSSSSTSQSFTQWRLPVHQQYPSPPPNPRSPTTCTAAALLPTTSETYHSAECLFAAGNSLQALRLLERAFTPDPSPPGPCPPSVMLGVVAALLDSSTARPAAKVLLALLLNETNRTEAARAGVAAAALEAVMASGPAGATAERGLAALELLCTVREGAEAVRSNPIAAPALACAVEGMSGRGRECAIGVLAAIFGCGGGVEVPAEVARAVVTAMQGECSARGRRKGAQLLKALQDSGRLDVAWDGIGGC